MVFSNAVNIVYLYMSTETQGISVLLQKPLPAWAEGRTQDHGTSSPTL